MNCDKYYLVEDYDPAVAYKDGRVVTLTPEACYHLGKAGVPYDIIENFYNEKSLKSDEEGYFTEQLEWFKEFDKLLKEQVSYCRQHDIDLAKANYYQLKYLIDPIIINARILQEFVKRTNPEAIVYVCGKNSMDKESSIYDLYGNERKYFLKLISVICRKNNIPLSIKSNLVIKRSIDSGYVLRARLKDFLKKLHFKSIYYFIKYAKIRKFFTKPKNDERLNLLILHAGCLSMDIVVKKSIALGYRVFFRDKKNIISIYDIAQKNVLDLNGSDDAEKDNIAGELKKAADDMDRQGEMIKWTNDRCGLDLLGLIMPYLKHFVEKICLNNLLEVRALKKFYKDERIDYVIARSSSEEDSISAFTAVGTSKKRVCFQHGIPYDTIPSVVTELNLVDYYFTMDDISHRYYKDQRLDPASDCRVFQSPHYLMSIRDRMTRKSKNNTNTIMYAPTKVFIGLNVFNVNFYTLPWYFEFQKAIIDLFGSIKSKRFIYKCANGQEWLDRSVLLYLKDKEYNNIQIEKKPLIACLGQAERLLLDFPGTCLYEAAAAGVPVMSLCRSTFKINDDMRAAFGRSIIDFSGISDGINKIRDFIYSEPDKFKVDVPMSDEEPFAVLSGIKKQNEKITKT